MRDFRGPRSKRSSPLEGNRARLFIDGLRKLFALSCRTSSSLAWQAQTSWISTPSRREWNAKLSRCKLNSSVRFSLGHGLEYQREGPQQRSHLARAKHLVKCPWTHQEQKNVMRSNFRPMGPNYMKAGIREVRRGIAIELRNLRAPVGVVRRMLFSGRQRSCLPHSRQWKTMICESQPAQVSRRNNSST
jgi:hypothetical protein